MPQDSRQLLDRYRQGDDSAADVLFARYTSRLLNLARSRLSTRLARRVAAEDVVQSAYRSFFRHAQQGEFAVAAEGDLWRLLATITLHKLWRQAKHHAAAKRSQRREIGGSLENAISLAELAGREPSTVDVVMAADELRWLMAQLEPAQRQAVELRLQEMPIGEIATKLGKSERSIRRWLTEARALLSERWADAQHRDTAAGAAAADHAPIATCDRTASLRHADYRLQSLIAAGGTAKVYQAVHRTTGHPVAVKVLRKRFKLRSQMVDRFVREAQFVARFDHANIVRVHGRGRLPDGGYFMVMDFVDGDDLQRICAAGSLAPAAAVRIVAAAADAIEYAHQEGVIHCDLKPGNVLIDRSGRVLVTDFGFAQTPADSGQDNASIAGTAGFMAPEQIDPSRGGIGPATDVYGLGALLLMLVSGRPPHGGGSVSEILDRVARSGVEQKSPDLPASLPHTLRAILERCLMGDWRRRFASAAELARALRSWDEQPNENHSET